MAEQTSEDVVELTIEECALVTGGNAPAPGGALVVSGG
jgi:hypothetical protein